MVFIHPITDALADPPSDLACPEASPLGQRAPRSRLHVIDGQAI